MTPPVAEPALSTPRRRLKKRWLVLALFVALPLIAGWLIFRDPPLAVMHLPDGRTFTIHKLTYGKEHHYRSEPALTQVETWMNQWLARVGRQIAVSFSGGGGFGNSSESVCLWHSFDWTSKTPETTPSHLVLTDSHGWRTAIDMTYLPTTPRPVFVPGQPFTPAWLTGPLVSPSPRLQVQLFNAQRAELASTHIPYDVPQNLRQVWTAQSLPATESDGNFSVTLKGVHASWPKRENLVQTTNQVLDICDTLDVTLDCVVSVDGAISSDWSVMTSGVPFNEMITAGAAIQSPQGWFSPLSFCAVSPYESLWKIYLPFICHNPDKVPATNRASLGRTKFDQTQPMETTPHEAVSAGEAKVQFLGVGRAGSFNYEGAGEALFAFPGVLQVEWASRRQMQGTFQLAEMNQGGVYGIMAYARPAIQGRPPREHQRPMTVTAKFTAPRPHVAISVDKSGDRFPYLIVKDENGRLLEGELFNLQGLLVWLAKEAYDDVHEVDVTLLLQKPREFTFVVPPPAVPPRPAKPSR